MFMVNLPMNVTMNLETSSKNDIVLQTRNVDYCMFIAEINSQGFCSLEPLMYGEECDMRIS